MNTACTAAPRALIADDHHDVLQALRLLLTPEGICTELVTSPSAVLHALETQEFDLLLMDLNYTRDTTSGREGLDLLADIQALDATLPVVVRTGWGSVDLAVEAMRRGVRDFVQKPWDNRHLIDMFRTEIEEGRARRRHVRERGRELAEARLIQQQLLPQVVPQIEGWTVSAAWRPASGVGGDCYDVTALRSNRLALSIADVVGKGIPAALMMANLQATVRAFASDGTEPSDLCANVNRVLSGNVPEGKFVTFFYAVLDGERRRLVYANAGHFPPVLARADGSLLRLDCGGTVLGVFPDAIYEQAEVPLYPGDRLVLFTDGIIEARNPEDEEFGDARLLDAIVSSPQRGGPGLMTHIFDLASVFAGGALQDDATVLVVAGADE